MAKDKRVDAYIAKSADFAQPILEHLRKLVHNANPDVLETMKWSFPHFDYKGIVCSMASFKQHCAFGFWKQELMKDPDKLFSKVKEGMGSLGQIKTLKDLPSDKILLSYINEAIKLNEDSIKLQKKPSEKEKKDLIAPPYLLAALRKNKKAGISFNSFSYSHRKEYIEWLEDAKTEATRNKRLAFTIEWLTEGKSRMWKYERKK